MIEYNKNKYLTKKLDATLFYKFKIQVEAAGRISTMKFSLFCLMSLLMANVCSAGRIWQGTYL